MFKKREKKKLQTLKCSLTGLHVALAGGMISQFMSKQFRLAALFVLSAALLAADPIRIVAWNIEWFPGGSFEPATPEREREQMELAQNVLQRLRPDILVCSEIRDWRSFQQLVEPVEGLRVSMVSSFRSRDDGTLWRQQLAVASRLPVVAAWAEDWRPTLPSLVRGFSFAALEDPLDSQKVILVYSLHLKSNRAFSEAQVLSNYRQREESAHQLITHVAEMERLTFRDRITGIIIAGDLNTNHDGQFGDETIAILERGGFYNTWSGVPREERFTWRGSSQFQPTTFDYIMTKGFERARPRLFEVPAEVSDHHPIVIEVRRSNP